MTEKLRIARFVAGTHAKAWQTASLAIHTYIHTYIKGVDTNLVMGLEIEFNKSTLALSAR